MLTRYCYLTPVFFNIVEQAISYVKANIQI